ncbi:hypothetical protein KUTeg_010398 [Tegillarca granosa]|uniref:BHLH domain-containing protein n=1 Tax=Tegillarca granosa TaxID=220873 RepID=A0ABQ9F6K7_TEGGR|nr:hypothetical protein KUTeg_010398 [Tegillarca granosa]
MSTRLDNITLSCFADGRPRDVHGYARMSANDSDTSPDSSNSGRYRDEDGREKRRAGGAGTREVHNKLEKNRRAHLKECFECLKKQIPTLEDKRTSNLSILRGSLRYIQALRRKEKEYELEMQKLAREKISLQERIATLKSELTKMNIEVDINQWIKVPDEETDSNSTSTATEQGSPIVSDIDDDEDDDMDEENDEQPRNKKQMFSVKEVIKKTTADLAAAHKEVISSQGAMTVLKVAPPAYQQNMKNLPKQGIHAATTSVITMATSATTGTGHVTLQSQRPPVTQILAQTLNQKLVQKQRETVISGGDLVEKSPVAQILAQQLNKKTTKSVDKPPLQQMVVDNNPSPSHNLEILAQALSQRQVIQKPKNMEGTNTQQLIPSSLSSISTAGSTDHSDRTPVTQILAQQLNQRQMLQRQKSMDTTVTTTQTSLAKSVPQIVKSLSVRPSLSFTPINTQLMANPIHQLALNRLANIGTVPNQAAALTAIPTSTPTKTPAQPILVSNFHLASQLNAPPLAATTTTKMATTTATVTNTLATSSQKTPSSHNEAVTTVSQSLSATAVTAVPTIRPIIGTPGSHFMASPLTPLNALLAQTIPRTTMGAVLHTVPSSTVTYTTAGPNQTASIQQLMSLAQMAPGTQLFSPMTVVSPNGNLVTTGIPQAQLNNVLMTQPLLKQIPVLTPAGILQGGQLSQMIGQPVVKPFVVVSVPSITTTTAPPAASVAVTVAMTTTS